MPSPPGLPEFDLPMIFADSMAGLGFQSGVARLAFAANTLVIVVLQLIVLQRIEGRRRTRVIAVMGSSGSFDSRLDSDTAHVVRQAARRLSWRFGASGAAPA